MLVIGAGGHARVVADCAIATGRFAHIAYLDDRPPRGDDALGPVLGRPGDMHRFKRDYPLVFVAIGVVDTRLKWLEEAMRQGFDCPVIVHPIGYLSAGADVRPGSVLMAQAVVQPGARLAEGVIVNTAASVDHDCRVGRGAHIAPGARLGGSVTVGERTWIGIGAVVREGIRIGSRVTVGAGAAVVEDIPDGVTVVGVPARVIQHG